MAVGSLVLGIISLVFAIVPFLNALGIGIIPGLIGIVLGALGRKDPAKKGMATAGLVCSIIGLVLCILLFVACGGCAACSACAGAANIH